MSSQPSTIVPANRLGQLLAEARHRTGTDLEELSSRSDGDFTIGELSDLEAGHRLLDDSLIKRVTRLYEVDCGVIIPQRAELTIDLNTNIVSAAGQALPLESTARDHILDRYLSLVYVLRNRPPGTTVPLRDEDVAILAASLAERSELVEEQLLAAMAADTESVRGLIGWFRTRLWVPGAGALVGAVSVGTLVMVSSDGGGRAVTETVDVDPAKPNPTRLPVTGALSASSSNSSSTSTSTTSSSSTTGAPALVTTPSTASSSTTSSSTSSSTTSPIGTPEGLGAAAEALMPFDVRAVLPGWTIVYEGPNSSFRGLTFPYDHTIEVYVRASDTPESLAGILAHEVGHAIDVTHFDTASRNTWLESRNNDGGQWWPDAYASDFETGAGDFAEAFAFWAVGDDTSSRMAGTPTPDQLELLEELVSPYL